jgi:hypothetical protein
MVLPIIILSSVFWPAIVLIAYLFIADQHSAEKIWLDKFKEIPDGFCLRYRGGKCRLVHNLKTSFSLEEWLRLPAHILDQIDLT